MSTQENLMRRMLEDMMADVAEFHEQVVHVATPPEPTLLTIERQNWSVNFLQEELDEFKQAHHDSNLPDAVDALVDLIYVAIGRLLEMGVPPTEAWDPVQRANMAKQRGKTHRGVDTDAAKPEGWLPPDHETLMKNLVLRSAVPPAMLEATAVLLQRGAAYNKGSVTRKDHFPLGMASIFTMLWIKIIRMRSDVEAGHVVNRDHLIDIINYANFGVNLLDGREL